MKKYQYLFFDLDGTISDSAPGIVNSVLHAAEKMGLDAGDHKALLRAEKMGLDAGDHKALLRFVGPPLPDSFRDYLGLTEEQIQEAIPLFRGYYGERGILENVMYEGMDKLLEAVTEAGFVCAVATSKPEPFARIIIERYGLDKYFRYIAGCTIEETRTDKGEVIAYAMEACGITDPSKVLMIGDRRHDVIGSGKHKMDCVGVLYGYGSREELEEAGAMITVESVSSLQSYLLSLS